MVIIFFEICAQCLLCRRFFLVATQQMSLQKKRDPSSQTHRDDSQTTCIEAILLLILSLNTPIEPMKQFYNDYQMRGVTCRHSRGNALHTCRRIIKRILKTQCRLHASIKYSIKKILLHKTRQCTCSPYAINENMIIVIIHLLALRVDACPDCPCSYSEGSTVHSFICVPARIFWH